MRMVAVGQLPRKFGKRQTEAQGANLQRRGSLVKGGMPGKGKICSLCMGQDRLGCT